VRAAIHGIDIVGKGEHRFGVPLGVLQGYLDGRALYGALDVERLVQALAVAVQVAHKRLHAALEVKGLLRAVTLVEKVDRQAAGEKGHLAEALGERLEAIVQHVNDRLIGEEASASAMPLGRAVVDHRGYRNTALVALGVAVPLVAHLDLEPARQGVHGGDADAVEPAGHLVASTAELAAGVQHRVYHFQRVPAGRLFLADGNATAVVGYRHRRVLADDDVDTITDPGEGLVDGVVDHFGDQVVQAADVGAADVHARPAADGL